MTYYIWYSVCTYYFLMQINHYHTLPLIVCSRLSVSGALSFLHALWPRAWNRLTLPPQTLTPSLLTWPFSQSWLLVTLNAGNKNNVFFLRRNYSQAKQVYPQFCKTNVVRMKMFFFIFHGLPLKLVIAVDSVSFKILFLVDLLYFENRKYLCVLVPVRCCLINYIF